MKQLKLLVLILSFFHISVAMADGYSLYADKIHELEKRGHINPEEAQEKIYALRLRDKHEARAMRKRARGVASAIAEKKVIKFTNKPIEVSVSNN